MEHEWLVVLDGLNFSETLDRLANVDVGVAVIAEHAELPVEPDVHGGGLQRVFGERLDSEPPRGERLAYRSVGENHGSFLEGGSVQMLPRARWREQVGAGREASRW